MKLPSTEKAGLRRQTKTAHFPTCRTGAVTKEQLKAAPWKLLAGIGLIEALSQVLGFIGASKLPGALHDEF